MASTTYYWDEVNDNLFGEEGENGEIVASYTHEPGLYGELIAQQRDGETRYYNFDALDNTSELIDENENVTDTYEFTAFGEEIARTGTTENPFGYKAALGYYTNIDTNDVYVRARVCEVTTGRWLSVDPLRSESNLYAYARNQPSNLGDPSGLLSIRVTKERLDAHCGGAVVQDWRFELSTPAKCSGYIVQVVTAYCDHQSCGDCPATKFANVHRFTERFAIAQGKTSPALDDRHGWFYTPKDTCGHRHVHFHAKFYCDKDVEDLKPASKRKGRPNSIWQFGKLYGPNGCQLKAGESIEGVAEMFRKKPVEGPVFGDIQVHWNCCCERPFSAARARPSMKDNSIGGESPAENLMPHN